MQAIVHHLSRKSCHFYRTEPALRRDLSLQHGELLLPCLFAGITHFMFLSQGPLLEQLHLLLIKPHQLQQPLLPLCSAFLNLPRLPSRLVRLLQRVQEVFHRVGKASDRLLVLLYPLAQIRVLSLLLPCQLAGLPL